MEQLLEEKELELEEMTNSMTNQNAEFMKDLASLRVRSIHKLKTLSNLMASKAKTWHLNFKSAMQAKKNGFNIEGS